MKRIGLFVLLAVTVVFAACSPEGPGGEPKDNQAPNVWLSAAPPEGSIGKYIVHLYWGGWDPDGEIDHYEYLITDNSTGVLNPADKENGTWYTVFANDSTFTFTADSLLNPGTQQQKSEFVRSHTFFIRAVDEEGLKSRDVYRSFTSRTLSPVVTVDVPRGNNQGISTPSSLPPIPTFRWTATDYISDDNSKIDPESVQYALVPADSLHRIDGPFGDNYDKTLAYLRTPASKKDWSRWIYYKAPGDSGKFWTPPTAKAGGAWVFAVRAKDEAQAITPVLDFAGNARRVYVRKTVAGPQLNVSNVYMGTFEWLNCKPPARIFDLPSGVPLTFRIAASASYYGGAVSAYRYGWDIGVLEDPEQWEVGYTPFVQREEIPPFTWSIANTPSRAFFFSTHTLTIEVIDNNGSCSRVEVKVNIVQFTFRRNLLLVDDYKADKASAAGWIRSNGQSPSDQEHDAFWLDMVSNVDGFDPTLDVVEVDENNEVDLAKLADYKSIIWSASGGLGVLKDAAPVLKSLIGYRSASTGGGGGGKTQPNLLALFMAAGGHVLVSGLQPVQNVIPSSSPQFPYIFKYELEKVPTSEAPTDTAGAGSFAYRELCLETLDFTTTSARLLRRPRPSPNVDNYCPLFSPIQNQRNDSIREALPLDSDFPLLQLRPECSAATRYYEPAQWGLDPEIYNPGYFATLCVWARSMRQKPCFQPIYGLGSLSTSQRNYNQPVAFFTSAMADRVAPGTVPAKSAVFGFPPVYFNPSQVKPAIENILFDEWQLPRTGTAVSH